MSTVDWPPLRSPTTAPSTRTSPGAGLSYAAFLLDPDGNDVEAVHRGEYPT